VDVPSLGADDPGSDRARHAQRRANCQNAVADFHNVTVAQFQVGQRLLDVQPHDGQVGLGIGENVFGDNLPAVLKMDFDLLGAMNDMLIGQNDTFGIDHEPGTKGPPRLRFLRFKRLLTEFLKSFAQLIGESRKIFKGITGLRLPVETRRSRSIWSVQRHLFSRLNSDHGGQNIFDDIMKGSRLLPRLFGHSPQFRFTQQHRLAHQRAGHTAKSQNVKWRCRKPLVHDELLLLMPEPPPARPAHSFLRFVVGSGAWEDHREGKNSWAPGSTRRLGG
jgi:hypothetical protein